MKIKLLTITAVFASLLAFSQDVPPRKSCGSHIKMLEQLESDPAFSAKRELINSQAGAYTVDSKNSKKSETVITIPVVVHVIYNSAKTAENISIDQINSQLAVLNRDFNKLNTDHTKTPAEWTSLVADVKINFVLATVDPSGNTTSGITRKSSTKTAWSFADDMKRTSKGGQDPWDARRYMNIWVCNITDNTLGYAQFPGGSLTTDGVVICPQYFGNKDILTAAGKSYYLAAGYDLGRTGTHEVGHYLNLYHIWGDGACSASDEVADTPSAADANFGCPSYPKKSCNTNDMTMNYMDYTDDGCMYMFTNGQKTRMRALFAPGGAREMLASPAGTTAYCTPTPSGTANGYISRVQLGTINKTSTGGGYSNFTTISTDLQVGSTVNFTITPAWTGSTLSNGYAIWIDYNNNGNFNDAGEKVFSKTTSLSTSITGSFIVPSGINLNTVRMRVGMVASATPTSCASPTSGDFEDYNVKLIASATPPPTGGDLVISEYAEGSSYNKALELTNMSTGSINLSNYSLKVNSNGGGTWTYELPLTGTLAAGKTYVIVYYRADNAFLLTKQDLNTTSAVLNFNGNDPVGLFKNGVLIDMFGVFGSGTANFAADMTMTRATSVKNPRSPYLASEWTQTSQNNFTGFGSHSGPVVPAGKLMFTEYVEGTSYNRAIEITNLTGETVDLSTYTLKKSSNGAATWGSTALKLSGILGNNKTFTIVYSTSAPEFLAKAKLVTSSSIMNFNGNDPIGLFRQDVLVDVIGTLGAGSAYFASDVTLIRKSTVSVPTTTFSLSQWDVKSTVDDITNLGKHTAGSITATARVSEEVVIPSDMTIFPNPAQTTDRLFVDIVGNSGTVTLSLYNSNGVMVSQESIVIPEGGTRHELSLEGLSSGIYFLNSNSGNSSLSRKLLIN